MTSTTRIFLSYAHEDRARAIELSATLKCSGIDCIRDEDHLCPGESLISFIESALRASDSCLLLWSSFAERSPWVRAEWEAALHRSIRTTKSFLVVGRLHDHPLPELLRPRLWVDLFPELTPGIAQLIDVHRRDEEITSRAGQPVAAHGDLEIMTRGGVTVYVISETFDFVLPVSVDVNEAQSVLLGRLVQAMDLPRTWSHKSGLGVRYTYRLVHGGEPLAGSTPLLREGVEAGALLELELEVRPFSSTPPRSGAMEAALFRAAPPSDDAGGVEGLARGFLRDHMTSQGLIRNPQDKR